MLGEVESLCGLCDTNLLISPLQTSNLGPTLGKHLKKSPNPQVRRMATGDSRAHSHISCDAVVCLSGCESCSVDRQGLEGAHHSHPDHPAGTRTPRAV